MKKAFFGFIVLGLLTVASAGELKIGWASGDITGNCPTIMPGQHYRRICQGVIDPLTANCLVLDDGKDCVIFLSTDTTGSASYYEILCKKVAKLDPKIPVRTKLICNATHTHSSGDHLGREPLPAEKKVGIVKGAWLNQMTDTAAKVVKQAWDSRKPGKIAWGYGYAVVGHQRRAVYFHDQSKVAGSSLNRIMTNGKAVMYGKTDDPDFSHFETGADPAINLLFTFDLNDKLTGAIINVPCPSQCSENAWKLSADYWHDTRKLLRAKYGKDLFILPQTAAAGDISPHLRSYQAAAKRKWRLKYGSDVEEYRDQYNRMDIAERIGQAFDEVYSWASKSKVAKVQLKHRVLKYRVRKFFPSEDEYKAAKFVVSKRPAETSEQAAEIKDLKKRREVQLALKAVERAEGVINRYEKGDKKETVPVITHLVTLGKIGFYTTATEMYIDYMHRIQARSPQEQVFAIELAAPGGTGGYLGTSRTMRNRGYGGVAASCQIAPYGGQQIVNAVVKNLTQMYYGKPAAKKQPVKALKQAETAKAAKTAAPDKAAVVKDSTKTK